MLINLCINILYFNGSTISPDSRIRKNLIVNILSKGTLTVDRELYDSYPELVKEYKGCYFTSYLPFFSMLALPFYYMASLAGSPDIGLLLFNLLTGTLCVYIFFKISMFLFDPEKSAVLTLIFVLTPFLGYYQKTFFTEPLVLLLNLCLYYYLLQKERPVILIIAINLVLFSGITVTYPFIVSLVVFFFFAVRYFRWNSLLLLPGPLAGYLFVFWYKIGRFGFSDLDSVYSANSYFSEYFSYFPEGFPGLLLSPGRGLLVLSPVLIPGAFLLLRNFRRHAFPVLLFLSYLFFYSGWIMWYGGVCFGPRFLVPVYPFLLFGLGYLSWKKSRRVAALLLVLLSFSVFIQIQSLRINSFRSFYMLQKLSMADPANQGIPFQKINEEIYSRIIWQPGYSPYFLFPRLKTSFMMFDRVYAEDGTMRAKVIFLLCLLLSAGCAVYLFVYFRNFSPG